MDTERERMFEKKFITKTVIHDWIPGIKRMCGKMTSKLIHANRLGRQK